MVEVLLRAAGRTFWEACLHGPAAFAPPPPPAPFACLLWDHGSAWPAADRLALAEALVRGGCRYVVCAGADAEAWHDSVDLARDRAWAREALVAHAPAADDRLVVTTWHSGEAPEEVAWFLVHATRLGPAAFREHLVLHVGRGPDQEVLRAAVRALAVQGGS